MLNITTDLHACTKMETICLLFRLRLIHVVLGDSRHILLWFIAKLIACVLPKMLGGLHKRDELTALKIVSVKTYCTFKKLIACCGMYGNFSSKDS